MTARKSVESLDRNLAETIAQSVDKMNLFHKLCENFVEHVNIFSTVHSPKKDDKIKVQYLVLWVGEEGRVICDGWGLSAEENILLTLHGKDFEEYAKPKSSFRFSRFQIRALEQEPTETVDAFMTRARIIANDCEFTDKEEQMMDTLIAGIHSNDIRRRLISKGKSTTL